MPQELSSGSRPEAASILTQNTSPDEGSGAVAQSAEALWGPGQWRNQLHRLEHLDLPLLGVGADKTRKAPANLRDGSLLKGWTTAKNTWQQINNACPKVIGCGTRTGKAAHGVLAFDLDGASAVSWCLERGCDPAQTRTWQIHRNTDDNRLKVLFQLSDEQQKILGQLKHKHVTKTATSDREKSEAVELFHQGGSQVIVLGQHWESKGHYFWPDGMGPEDLALIPESWWAAALELSNVNRKPTPSPAPRLQPQATELPPRSEAELLKALERVPKFHHDEGRRDELLGLAMRLTVEWGAEKAHAWLAQHSPTIKDLAGYFNTAPTQISPGSIWPFLNEHYGVSLKRDDLKRPEHTAAPATTKTQPKPRPKKERKPRKLGHTRAMACFERCVEIQAKRERNSLRRRARLLAIAKALGLAGCVNRQEIAQRVLDAKDEQQGHSFKALTAADRLAMQTPVVRWLIADLVPAGDLTIIGGRPKVGKTRLAVAIAAAVLKGEPFAGFGCIKEPRPVLLITDDQADGDTHQMLHQLKVWDHPHLMWSRHFRLNDRDIDAMLETIKANPGALVVVDSLRSVSRSLPAGENDPEIGAYLYDLKAAVIEAGGSLIVIHHCNKAADLVGTEALSGHNAIAGAANTVITLHHCPDANGRPDKSNTQRRLFSEGRSGAGCDVVIDRQAGGGYRQVCGFDQWQQQLSEAKRQQQASEGLTGTQQQLLELLEEEPGQAFTRRELVEALGLDWGDGRGSDPVRVRESLNRLATLELITKSRAGKEVTFTASHDGQNESSPSSPSSPSSHAKGFQGEDSGEENLSFLSFQSGQGVSGNGADPVEPSTAGHHTSPPTKERKERSISPETSPSDPLLQLEGEEGEEGEAHKHRREKKRPALIELFRPGQQVEVLERRTKQWLPGYVVLADKAEPTVKVKTPTGRTTNLIRTAVRYVGAYVGL